MSIESSNQIVVSKGGVYMVGRLGDVNPAVGDGIPVLNTSSGSIIMDTIAAVEMSTINTIQMLEMSLNYGIEITGTPLLRIMVYENNAFAPTDLSTITSGTYCPVSLLLPNRIGVQIQNGLSINVSLNQNSHDPMTQVPIATNTWGNMVVNFSDLPKFIGATAGIVDKANLEMKRDGSVQFSLVTSVLPVVKATALYTIRTTSGLPFMLANGFFVQSSSS
jgi:hypothetical protein